MAYDFKVILVCCFQGFFVGWLVGWLVVFSHVATLLKISIIFLQNLLSMIAHHMKIYP